VSGFAFRIVDGKATRIDVKEALTCTADLVWVHLSTTAEHAQAWLRDENRIWPKPGQTGVTQLAVPDASLGGPSAGTRPGAR
jgi:hypothetical protein